MSTTADLDRVRGAALDRIDRSQRNYRLVVTLAAIVEVSFIVAFVLLADFSNRLHVLLFLSTVASYTIVVLGLFGLGAHVSRNTLRVLKALESRQP
ncbi:MAG TPA: hypothetical protein VGF69_00225 [Thermoanaerobaculia bacterium]|jgi:predicted RND superfamily exporter protein